MTKRSPNGQIAKGSCHHHHANKLTNGIAKKKELKNGEDMDKTSQMAETTKDEMSLTTHATKNKALETM